ncbi:DNA-binding protein [Raoultella terrigena]|uniref:DNA-binding protein n=1 Tax=Raoultella terrigena TaxID=577 RepID=UPI003891BDB7
MKPQNLSDDDLLTPDEVCKLLGGITQKTLCAWNIHHRHRATLAPIRFSAKVVRYECRNVKAFIDKCRSRY